MIETGFFDNIITALELRESKAIQSPAELRPLRHDFKGDPVEGNCAIQVLYECCYTHKNILGQIFLSHLVNVPVSLQSQRNITKSYERK